MRKHNQVIIKVNTFVDKGIAEVVSILNQIDNVITFSSCEGKNSRNQENAHVYFYYGYPFKPDYHKMLSFAARLAKVLAANDSYDTDIALEWIGDKETPFISISMPSEQIHSVAMILNDHMNEFLCGILDKEPHHLREHQSH